jgi:amidohydrolase
MEKATLLTKVIEKSKQLYPQVVAYRRHLHQHPELSFEEYQTSAYIKSQLQLMGIEFEEVLATGVVAWVEGKAGQSTKTIVLRADIDALPIKEENKLAFSSQTEGVMHACGHDFHTANLLGVAHILKSLAHEFSGKVLLLFQPAEERIPGGAKGIIDSGILDRLGNNNIAAVLGLHVSPQLNTGQIGVCAGRFMASSDEIYLKIKGKGGHAAEPHRAIDPIMVTVQVLSALQQVVSRKANPAMPSVLTFGKIIGNGAANVISDEVSLEGTFRTMDETWRAEALQHIKLMVKQSAQMLGAQAELEIKNGYPVLLNNEALSAWFKEQMAQYFGSEKVQEIPQWMAAEDFAYYSHRYPALFFLVGIKNEQQRLQYGLHNAKFDLDEQAFLSAMQAMALSALTFLGGNNE